MLHALPWWFFKVFQMEIHWFEEKHLLGAPNIPILNLLDVFYMAHIQEEKILIIKNSWK